MLLYHNIIIIIITIKRKHHSSQRVKSFFDTNKRVLNFYDGSPKKGRVRPKISKRVKHSKAPWEIETKRWVWEKYTCQLPIPHRCNTIKKIIIIIT